ncbi:MAG: 16S rRNA (adenine(1518)-N(6)/adenine(1519)-N(6))-dimethyltransferase RsmA [Bacilli bacterium]
MFYSPKKIKEILNDNSFMFKKKFGQNFIVDENIIDSIIMKANLDKDTLVIEIGPGAGALTYKLANVSGFVVCYEIDKTLQPILNDNLSGMDNVKVIYEDFLKQNVCNELKKYKYSKIYVVANLPYYITTPIITKIIDDHLPIDKLIVMVQKEVGDRFKAKPNSRDYGSLTVFLNYYFDIKKELDVSRNVFLPKPNIDSVVVTLSRKTHENKCHNEEKLFSLIRDAFRQKRKNLRNNLKGYDLQKIESVLNKYNLDLNVRAEQLDLDVYIDIANSL